MPIPALVFAAALETVAASGVHKADAITVTAQKREEPAVEVPISIATVGGEELRRSGALSLDDLQFVVPNLSIRQTGFNRIIEVRGISNATGNSALVGQYIDEAVVTANVFNAINIGTYDLERVEVLRGPQGTLYGEGSAGGTIRFITRNPQLDRFAASADVAASATRGGAPSHGINAMLNAPLVADELGVRFAGTFAREGGWIDQPAAQRRNIDRQSLADARIKGLWQPNARFTVNALATVYRDHRGLGTQEDANGNFTQTFHLTDTPRVKLDHDLLHVAMAYDFPAARLLGATTYLRARNDARNDAFRDPLLGPGAEPFEYFAPFEIAGFRGSSQELRLTSTGAGAWRWTVGAFHRHERRSFDTLFHYGQPGPPRSALPEGFGYQSRGKSDSASLFADTSYRLTDRLTLGAGIRSYRDRQSDSDNFIAPATQRDRFHSMDPRAYARYRLAEGVNIYASAARGFRSGAFAGLDLPNAGPESVWSYELGAKTSMLGGRLRFDAALFHSDYRDYQGLALSPIQGIVVFRNVGDARIRGIEWDLAWRAMDRWSLAFNGSYLDSRFTRIDSLAYVEGDPVDHVPKYQFAASVARDFGWRGMPGFVRLDYSQRGAAVTRNRSIGPWWYGESDVIRLLNFKAHLGLSRRLGLGLFARNVLDDRGFIMAQVSGVSPRPRPRTIGVEFNVDYD